MRVVDIHAHLYPKAYLDLLARVVANDGSPWARAVAFLLDDRIVPNRRMWDVEAHIEDMDQAGVEEEVLSLSCPMSYFSDEKDSVEAARIVNDSLAEICARYPKRFTAFASLPRPHPDASLKELDRAINDLGLHGVGLGANALHARAHLDDERILPIYPELSDRALTVFLHPAIPPGVEEMYEHEMWVSAGFLMDSTIAVLRLAHKGVFEQNKGMKFVVPHLGTFLLAGIDRVAGRRPAQVEGGRPVRDYMKELYYDSITANEAFWDCAVSTVGLDRIVFGTDYPFPGPGSAARGIERISALPISDAEKEAIFSGTADRLLSSTPASK
jgi:aminocarboxymuconate-semialdehyde decarboxylase